VNISHLGQERSQAKSADAGGDSKSTSEESVDLILEVLANLLRTYGRFGFELDHMDAETLEHQCNAWARHLLIKAPAPVGQATAGVSKSEPPSASNARHWADLQQFFRNHRREEQSAVRGKAEQVHGLVAELATGLRAAIVDDTAKDDLVGQQLSALNEAVKGNSLPQIRHHVAKTVELVSTVVRERQARYEAQLRSMSVRVRNLRADLIEVREQATLDPLTRLHNRRAFDNLLSKQIDFSFLSGQPLALVMVDIDHFKKINDAHGHQAGDTVIKAVADTLVRVFPRRTDFVARYGGEEFAVILVDVAKTDLALMGARIIEAIRGLTVEYRDSNITLSCSVGVTDYQPRDNAEGLLFRADQALYRAKKNGRDRFVISGT